MKGCIIIIRIIMMIIIIIINVDLFIYSERRTYLWLMPFVS